MPLRLLIRGGNYGNGGNAGEANGNFNNYRSNSWANLGLFPAFLIKSDCAATRGRRRVQREEKGHISVLANSEKNKNFHEYG